MNLQTSLVKSLHNPFMYAQNKNTLKNKWFLNPVNFLSKKNKFYVNSAGDDIVPETESSNEGSNKGSAIASFKQNLERKNFICVQAPTGSGKTYHMCHNAANLAQLGKTVVLAFPNKNLLNENVDFLKSILSKPDRVIHDTEICILTLEENVPGNVLLKKFCKGNVIIVTLHAYLLDKGDFKNFTELSYFIYLFSKNVHIFIDEGHLYLNTCEKSHNLNILYHEDRNGLEVLTSNQPFTNKTKAFHILKTLQVSPINVKYKTTYYNGVEIINPNFVTNSSINIKPFLSEEDLKSKIYQNSEGENAEEIFEYVGVYPTIYDKFNLLTSAALHNQPNLVNNGENYQISQTLKISGSPFFKTANYEAYRLKLHNSIDSHISMKKDGVDKLSNIFLINSCFAFLRNVKDDSLPEKTFKFFQEVKDKHPDLTDPTFLKSLENLENLGYYTFDKQISGLAGTLTETSPNYLTKLQMLHHFKQIWKEFFISYSKMVLKYGVINFNEIHPYDISDALSANFLTSSNAYLVTYFPSLNNKPIKNFEDFKQILMDFHSSQTQTSKSKKQKDSPKNSTYDFPESSVESSVESLTEVSTEDSNGNLPENSPEVDNKNLNEELAGNFSQTLSAGLNVDEKRLNYPSNPVYTAAISYTNMWPLLLLLQNEMTCLLSATYSLPVTHNLNKNLPTTSAFYKLKSEQPKLKRAFVFHTRNDYYNPTKTSWRSLWSSFGYYFYQNLTKPFGVLGLLITPSNRWAQNFYKNNLPTKKPFFSLVTSTKEAYGGSDDSFIDESSFEPSGPLKTRYCLRVCSVYSTVSVGLNLPEHKFIVCSLNNYKPSVALNNYSNLENSNINTFHANYYESLMSVNQSISRNARLSSSERDGISNSVRVYFLCKSNAYPGAVYQIAKILQEKFEEVYLINLKDLEDTILHTYRGAKYITNASKIYNNLGPISLKEILFPTYTIDDEISHVLKNEKTILSFPPEFSFDNSECIRLLLLQKSASLLNPQWDSVPIDKCFSLESFLFLLEAIRKLCLVLNVSEEISVHIEKSDGNFQQLKFPTIRDLSRKYNSSKSYDSTFFNQVMFHYGDTTNKIKKDHTFFKKLTLPQSKEDFNLNLLFFPKIFLACMSEQVLNEFHQFSSEITEDSVNLLKLENFQNFENL